MAKRIVAIIVLVLFTVCMASPALCDDPIKKLGRGIANVLTCPLEITQQMGRASDADGPIAGFTYGLLKGVAMTGVRALVGVYEIATFPVPFPQDYRPILRDPEFIWAPELTA